MGNGGAQDPRIFVGEGSWVSLLQVEMEDFELLREFQRGSEEAFRLLVERHVTAVYSVAWRTVRSREMAEEVTFSVFAELSRNAHQVKPIAPLIAWLFRVTRRKALDAVKGERRRLLRERAASEGRPDIVEQTARDEILPEVD